MRVRLAALLLLVATAPLNAQGAPSRRDCNLARVAWDNPLGSGGWYMRRWEWHVTYAATSLIASEALHRTTHIPRLASAIATTIALGLLPHVVGLARHSYPFNPGDVGFDALNRGLSLVVWTGSSGATWQSKTLAITTFVSAYAALACYASP